MEIYPVEYFDIIEEGLLNSGITTNYIPFLLQKDIARPHIVAFTRDWCERRHVTVPECPAASPSLNPTQTVWQIMKDHVENAQPKHSGVWVITVVEADKLMYSTGV